MPGYVGLLCGANEVNGHGYTRIRWKGAVQEGTLFRNRDELQFPSATGDWGVIDRFFVTTCAGRAVGVLSSPHHIRDGDTATFAPGSIGVHMEEPGLDPNAIIWKNVRYADLLAAIGSGQ